MRRKVHAPYCLRGQRSLLWGMRVAAGLQSSRLCCQSLMGYKRRCENLQSGGARTKKTKESFNHNPCKKNKSTTVLVYNYSFKQKIEHEFFKAVANAMQLGPSQWAAQKLLLEVGECLFSICRPTVGKQHDFTSEIPIGPMGLPNVAVARAAFTPPNNPRNCESINLGIYFTI